MKVQSSLLSPPSSSQAFAFSPVVNKFSKIHVMFKVLAVLLAPAPSQSLSVLHFSDPAHWKKAVKITYKVCG